jgi:ribonuclease HII
VSDSALLAHDLARGVRLIAGVDEVGRACLAGPIVAAGVLFDLERLASGAGRDLLKELDDSKRLGRAKRQRLAEAVLAHAEAVALVSVPAGQIDRIGISAANVSCLEGALRAVGDPAEIRLVDGELALGAGAPVHELIVHGDATSATIAAASIVAKVARDQLMTGLGERYPGYGFERHAGYGTVERTAAVAKLGPTPEHRLSFNAACFAEFRRARPVAAAARRRRTARPYETSATSSIMDSLRSQTPAALPSLAQLLTTAEAHGEMWAFFVRHADGVVELHQTDTFKVLIEEGDVDTTRDRLDDHLTLVLRAPVSCAEAMSAEVELLTTCLVCEELYPTD